MKLTSPAKLLRLVYLFLAILVTSFFSSCQKDETIISEKGTDYSIIRSALNGKIPDNDLNSLNYNSIKKIILKNNEIVYIIPFENDSRHTFTIVTNKTKSTFKETVLSISKNNFEFKSKDHNSGQWKTFRKSTNEIVTDGANRFSSTNSSNPDLPEVVVIAYTTSGSNLINFIIYDQLSANWSSTTGDILGYRSSLEFIEPAGDGASSGHPPFLGPILEFENDLEAIEFFEWQQNANPQEVALIAQYPVAALAIFLNSKIALARAQEWAAATGHALTDGKADAIRHAYWNALNVNDAGLIIATLFANAHEYGATRPQNISQSLWDLQRTMDLHNNSVGTGIAGAQGWGLFTSASSVWDYFYYGAVSGDLAGLKYICQSTGQLIFWSAPCP